MASLSLGPAVNFDTFSNNAAPRHTRKHSRHPTAAAPLPSFTFNPSRQPHAQNLVDGNVEQESDIENMVGSGHMRRPSKPSPLPEFKFNPGADIPVQRTPSPTHPILEEMAMNQQRVSKSAKPAPLPAFTFNPGPPSGSTSPTKVDAEADSCKISGHRRGGSEFVGGKADTAKLVTASPVKHESKQDGLPTAGSVYRIHHHQRSQAISVSDIDTSELIKQHAIAKARAPSLPSTPREETFSLLGAGPGQRQAASNTRSASASPRRSESRSGSRCRIVDFSDRVDVIPRPLSMISSETERSNSTIRGHSLSNSINSIASRPPSSPSDLYPLANTPIAESMFNRRPNTADASILLSSAAWEKEQSLLAMSKRPLSASGSPMISSSGSPPTKKKHIWTAYGIDLSPISTPKEESSDPFMDTPMTSSIVETTSVRPKTAPERPSVHKRKKYHTWTAGIFSKKSKPRASRKPRRTPTPPSLLRKDSDRFDDIFDADDTVVICEGSPTDARQVSVAQQRLSVPSVKPFSNEIGSPIIDLDAALEPSGDDRRHSEDPSRSTTAKIAKLHSSERRGSVDAFGINHRRTESAPALSPVNKSALFGMRQHGSNASLSEDVFDEEEEDNFLAHEEGNKFQEVLAPNSFRGRQALLSSKAGLGLTAVSSHNDDIVIVDPDNEAGTEDVRSSKSTIEAPAIVPEAVMKRPITSPMPFSYPSSQFHYASSFEGRTTSASLISSPDMDHLSVDTQSRPRRLGELNSESVRPSTDDLPSLSDSVSSHAFPRGLNSGNARPSLEHRSNSMFVAGSSRLQTGWKRSSIASLNRLIPISSHGSKTKLEGVSNNGEERSKKKSNRLSKLMRFWRSKDQD